jgi:ADP-ribosylglycohydrolase
LQLGTDKTQGSFIVMIGSIAGDMIGAPYEGAPIKHKDFDLVVAGFTDDTVLTVAVADALLNKGGFARTLKHYAQHYPDRGYGGRFREWIWSSANQPYGSFGNGAAMRVSPVGFAFDTAAEVLAQAGRSAAVTHNHPEGIKGAQAVALAILRARTGRSKEEIRSEMADRFGYAMERSVEEIRPGYGFDVSCQGSVPESIIAFLDAASYEDAIKNAVSLGGDADTMACIAGGIAQAFYRKIPAAIVSTVREKLPTELLVVVDRFNATYGCLF